MIRRSLMISALGSLAMASGSVRAQTAPLDPAGVEFFEKRIRPVLAEQCYKCHASTSEKLKGSLMLDSRKAALIGGETGPAVVPGHPEKSLLIEAVNYTNDDMKMPPRNRLPANVVADLKKWVEMGAPWPEDKSAVAAKPAGPNYAANYDKLRKEHWAWQPLHDSAPPAVKDASWPHNEIDNFVLAKLEAKGLKPVADADKVALIRRVTFDLTGLPPTPEEVASFVADSSPDAFGKRVDALLASAAFGERWGRHWLDIARYGESTGSARNVPYNYAWRYRDYVIDSFNHDKPYDQFITEQIAGDLLPYSTAQQRNDQVIATGFLAIGVKDLNERDPRKFVMDNVDEQIDVTTRSIMALTVSCARCHDHKFDPIPTTDYYAMAGIFKSTDILAGVQGRNKGANKKEYGAPDKLFQLANAGPSAIAAPAPAAVPPGNVVKLKALEAREATLRAELQRFKAAGKKGADAQARRTARQELNQIETQLDSLRGPDAPPPVATSSAGGSAMGVRDDEHPSDASVCLHGEPRDLGQEVPRGFISVVPVHSASTVDPSHSGRLQLAQWLVSTENPLTPRVMTNRIWAKLFGEGIVRTVDNFGSTGEAPADPELLDHLATGFMKDGWSVKKTVRQIVMSHAYQLSSQANAADYQLDPGNRLVWRNSSRRLDAEEIRDAMLAAGGKLDRTPLQGSLAAGLDVKELRNFRAEADSSTGNHRSVYLPILRDLVPPVLDLFDFAEPTMVIGTRDTTTVATQALYLLNDPFVISQAHNMAERVQNATGMEDSARIDLAYRLALSRNATPMEKARGLRYINDFQHEASYTTKDSLKNARADAWASFCQVLLGSAEFRYLN